MRSILGTVCLLVLAGSLMGAEPPEPQAEQERLRELVKAGAVPRAALQKAERDAEQSRWEQTLRETLFRADLTATQLPAMLDAAGKLRERARESLSQSLRLAEAGALPVAKLDEERKRTELAEKQYDLAQSRAEAIRSLESIARAERRLSELEKEDLAFHFDGHGGEEWETAWEETMFSLDAAFYHQFGVGLPVSAEGATAVHRSLGFDHSDRWDIAVHPDDPEGMFLLQLLNSWGIPYIAFRSSVPGQSTGPHIHVGPRSEPVQPEPPPPAQPAQP